MKTLAKSARIINLLANHPEVLPHISPEGTDALDFSVCFAPDRIDRVRFFHNGADDEDATASVAMLFEWTSPDVWALHMIATPDARGGPALAFAIEVIAEMYDRHGAKELWGETPVENKRARTMHARVGGIHRGFGTHPMFGRVELFATSRDEWRAFRAKYDMKNSEVA